MDSDSPTLNGRRPGQDGTMFLVLVCSVAALGGLLFGYDTAVIAGAIGFLQTHFELDAALKGWAAGCALVGCVIGVALAGPVSDRFGRRNTLILTAALFLISAIGTATPHHISRLCQPLAILLGDWGPTGLWVADTCLSPLGIFIFFRIVGGLGVGAASMTSPMFIAEISPARLRGRMVSVNQLAIVFGMLAVYFVNYFIAGYGDAIDMQAGVSVATETWNVTSGWQWMFGSESIPAVALLVLLMVVPESPRWLAKQGSTDKARAILARIGGPKYATQEMAEIESALAQESASLGQLLRPGMRIVLAIGVVLAVLQQVTGINVFLYYAPEIFKTIAGNESDVALLQTIIVGAVNLVFTFIAIWTVDRVGRKPLMIVGATGMAISLTALGLAACYGRTDVWVLAFILGYIACFAMSVGPVTWVILSEIFPTKIRGRAMGIATFCLWVANFVISLTFPMMDESTWLVEKFNHGFPFFVYAGFSLCLVVFVALVVPETKGRTLEQIERLWRVIE